MLRKSLNRLSAHHECYTVFSCINSTTGEPLTEWLAELNNKVPPFFVVPSDQHFRCVFRITSTERQIVHDCPVMLLYYSVQWCSPAPGLVCQVFRVWFPSSEFAITVIDPTRRADVEEQAACWRCGKSFCFHMLQFTQAPAEGRHLWVLSSLLPVLLLKGTTSTVNSLWFSCALGAKIVPHWGFNVPMMFLCCVFNFKPG